MTGEGPIGKLIDKALDALPARLVKWIAVPVLLVAVALVVHSDAATWKDASSHLTRIERHVTDSIVLSLGLVSAAIGYLAWIALVQYSHRRWLSSIDPADRDRYYCAEGLDCTVGLEERWNDDKRRYERGVLIENTGTKVLRSVTGRVRLYDRARSGTTRTAELRFKTKEIEPGGRAIARAFEARDKTGRWNRFDAFIERLVTDAGVQERLVQDCAPIWSYYSVYENRKRRAFWPRRRRYDTWWIQSTFHRSVRPWVRMMLGPDSWTMVTDHHGARDAYEMALARADSEPTSARAALRWIDELQRPSFQRAASEVRFDWTTTRTWRSRARGLVVVLGLGALVLVAALGVLSVVYLGLQIVIAVVDVAWQFLQRKFT